MLSIGNIVFTLCSVILLHPIDVVVSFSSIRFKKSTFSTTTVCPNAQLFQSISRPLQPIYLKASQSDDDNTITITEAVAKKDSSVIPVTTTDGASTLEPDFAIPSNDTVNDPAFVKQLSTATATTKATESTSTSSSKTPAKPKKAVMSSKASGSDWLNGDNQLKYSTVFGATLFGLIFGSVLEVAVHDENIVGWAPQLSALLFSGTSYRLIMLDDSKQAATKVEELKIFSKSLLIKIFGTPLLNLQRSVSSKIQSKIKETVSTIQSIPDNTKKAIIKKKDDIAEEVQIKIENTKDEIKAIPIRVSAAAQQKVQEQILEVKATPKRVSEKLANLYQSFIYQVSLIPGKVSASVQSTANRKKQEFVNTVNKKIENAQYKYNSFVSTLPIPLPKSNIVLTSKTASNAAPLKIAAQVKAAVAPVKVADSVKAIVADSVKAIVAPVKVAEPVKAVVTPARVAEPVKVAIAPLKVSEPVKAAAAPVKVPEPVKASVAPAKVPEPVKVAAAPAKVPEPVKTAAAPVKVTEPVKATVAPIKVDEPVKAAVASTGLTDPVKAVNSSRTKLIEPVRTTPAIKTESSSNPFASFFGGRSSSKSTIAVIPPKAVDIASTSLATKSSAQPVVLPTSNAATVDTPVAPVVAKPAVVNSASSPYAYLFANKKNETATVTVTAAAAAVQTKPSVIVKTSVSVAPTVPATVKPLIAAGMSSVPIKANSQPSITPTTTGGLFSFGNNRAPAVTPPSPTSASSSSDATVKNSSSSSSVTSSGSISNSNSQSSPILTENVRKSLTSAAKLSSKELDIIDSTLQSYMEGSLAAENVYRQLVQSCNGNKDIVFNIFPDVIGALPRGDRKSNLNRFCQQQAF